MESNDEQIRSMIGMQINKQVESNDIDLERKRLEEKYGKVWDTKELQKEFQVHSFLAPFVCVTRKVDKEQGMLMFQHLPRFYYCFEKK